MGLGVGVGVGGGGGGGGGGTSVCVMVHWPTAISAALQRTGLLGTETEELALGAGASYRTLNLFGGGEVLTLRTTGSVAGDFAEGFPTA